MSVWSGLGYVLRSVWGKFSVGCVGVCVCVKSAESDYSPFNMGIILVTIMQQPFQSTEVNWRPIEVRATVLVGLHISFPTL